MNAIERIEALIRMEEQVEQKDDAGVYIPQYQDAAKKIEAFRQCLQIVRDYECSNVAKTLSGA